MDESMELAVDVKNVVFEYNKKIKVLKNLSLQVPKGKIFALLGPNGAGKTTLIRAILGRLKISNGSIKVFGIRPGTRQSDIPGIGVGYMPQELALFEEFSIREILTYYGMIYHLNPKELKQRIDTLIEILNLPEKSRTIVQLSGGQQRRVSIAVTMIHRPKLVILDEPTVGVDCILRCRIWEYLENICRLNGQTVIITTHYIEEARRASNVAFMSSGTILKQSNPETLLTQFQCKTLEEVFLILCQNSRRIEFKDLKDLELNENTISKPIEENECKTTKTNNNNNNKLIDFKRVKAMVWKYSILTYRRPLFLVMFYAIPLIAFLAMNYSIGPSPYGIPVAVYNADDSPELSKRFLESFDKKYVVLKEYKSNESAYESVVRGKNYMSIVFTQNFSETFETRLTDLFDLTDEELDLSQIRVNLDNSNAAIGAFVLQYLLQTLKRFLDGLSQAYNYNIYRYMCPIELTEIIYGNIGVDISTHFGPAIMIALMQSLPMVLSAFQIVWDRKNASFERVFVAGVKPIEYFIAHWIQNLILIAFQVLFAMIFSFVIFQNTQLGSYVEVYIMLALQGVLGMSIGLLGALVLADEVSVAVGITAFMLPLWIMSGVLWPLESIPNYFRYVSDLTPITQPLEALRSVMLRGWTYSRPNVLYGYIFSLIYILIISVLNMILFQKDSDKAFTWNVWNLSPK